MSGERPRFPPRKRILPYDHEVFAECNAQRERFAKCWTHDPAPFVESPEPFHYICPVAGCKAGFPSLAAFSLHYKSRHSFQCSTCHAVFPSEHWLGIHVQERHDSYFRLLAQRKPMYECLVSGCGVLSVDRASRKAHLLNAHSFPRRFTFDKLRARMARIKGRRRAKARKHRARQRKKAAKTEDATAMRTQTPPRTVPAAPPAAAALPPSPGYAPHPSGLNRRQRRELARQGKEIPLHPGPAPPASAPAPMDDEPLSPSPSLQLQPGMGQAQGLAWGTQASQHPSSAAASDVGSAGSGRIPHKLTFGRGRRKR